jgi:hypothetical protein
VIGQAEELTANPFLGVVECEWYRKGKHNDDIELREEVAGGDGAWGKEMEGGGEAKVR